MVIQLRALGLNKKIFEVVGLHPCEETLFKRLIFLSTGIFLFILVFVGLISSILTIIKYLGNDFDKVLYGLFQIGCLFSTSFSWIVLFLSQQKVKTVFNKFQQAYDRGNPYRKPFKTIRAFRVQFGGISFS